MASSGESDTRLRRGERFARADYRRAFAEGKSFPSRSFVAWVVPSSSPHLRKGGGPKGSGAGSANVSLGVVVSKRTFRLAVERSRARRLMRAAFRLSKHCLAPDVGILLVGRRHLVEPGVTSADVAREFQKFCRRAKVAASGATPAPRPAAGVPYDEARK